MTKLNQIVAAEKGAKSRADRAVTDLYHRLKKTALFTGIVRTYQPIADEGEKLPPESTPVQANAEGLLHEVANALVPLLDLVLTKDSANTLATASVKVGGTTIVSDVPVTYLLFLEKKLGEIRVILSHVPILDPSETWSYDPNIDAYRADPVQTTRTKKVPRNHVLAEATERHPAQVTVWHEDVVVGYWTKSALSGAMTAARVKELTDRVDVLLTAVRYAREEANGMEIEQFRCGKEIFEYLFAR